MFILGFYEQLIRSRAGKIIKVILLPMKYDPLYLAGKEVTFDTTVKEVDSPYELEISDETAKKLGFDRLFICAALYDRKSVWLDCTSENKGPNF